VLNKWHHVVCYTYKSEEGLNVKRYVSIILLAVTFLISIPVLQVMAADAGDPIFPMELREKSRMSVVYESINRGLEVTTGPDATRTIKADTLYLRVHNEIGQTASVDVDIGAINPKGGDYDYYVGAGLRMLVIDTDPMRISVFAQLHYSPIEIKSGGTKTDFDYFEGDGGVIFALKVPVDNQVVFMPYLGPVISIVRLDGDVRDTLTGVKSDYDAEEKNLLGIAGGLSLKLKENHTIRAEIRYFDQVNFSVAAAVAF